MAVMEAMRSDNKVKDEDVSTTRTTDEAVVTTMMTDVALKEDEESPSKVMENESTINVKEDSSQGENMTAVTKDETVPSSEKIIMESSPLNSADTPESNANKDNEAETSTASEEAQPKADTVATVAATATVATATVATATVATATVATATVATSASSSASSATAETAETAETATTEEEAQSNRVTKEERIADLLSQLGKSIPAQSESLRRSQRSSPSSHSSHKSISPKSSTEANQRRPPNENDDDSYPSYPSTNQSLIKKLNESSYKDQQLQQQQQVSSPLSMTSDNDSTMSAGSRNNSGLMKNSVLKAHNISSVVWKLRSSAAYSSSAKKKSIHAWERRRLVLAGTKLLYYDLTGKDIAESMGAIEGGVQLSPRVHGTFNESQNLGARGMINLLRPGVRVLPVTGFKTNVESELEGPTPFGMNVISISGNDINNTNTNTNSHTIHWHFCFDSVVLQAEWISALNDVVDHMKYLAAKQEQLLKIKKKQEEEEEERLAAAASATATTTVSSMMEWISAITQAALGREDESVTHMLDKAYNQHTNPTLPISQASSSRTSQHTTNDTDTDEFTDHDQDDSEYDDDHDIFDDEIEISEENYREALSASKKSNKVNNKSPSVVKTFPNRSRRDRKRNPILRHRAKTLRLHINDKNNDDSKGKKKNDLEYKVWNSSTQMTDKEQTSFVSRESKSRYCLGKAHLLNGNLEQAKDSFIKTLESRLVLYGPNDPETAVCYESLADVAVAKGNSAEAMKLFNKSLTILSECKLKLNSTNYLLLNNNKSNNNTTNTEGETKQSTTAVALKDDLTKQPSFLILDVAQKRIEDKIKHMDENMLRYKSYKEKKNKSKQEREGIVATADATSDSNIKKKEAMERDDDIYKLHKELRRKEVLSKIAVGMKERLNEAVKEKQFIIDSLREQLEERTRNSVAMVEECESMRGKLMAMKKYVASKEEELVDKNETIEYLMTTLETTRKKLQLRDKR